MMWIKFLLAVVVASICHVPLAATAQEQLQVRSAHTNSRNDLLVVVELPPGATPQASEFSLLIDNKSVAIAKEIHGQDVAVTLLVDISLSMKGPPLNDAKEALLSLVGKARANDGFTLVSFADNDTVESALKEPRKHLTDAISHLKAVGQKTKLYQALHKALGNKQNENVDKRQVLIVVSDGKDEGSTETLDSVIAKSKDAGTPIHAVFRGQIEKQFGDVLGGLAQATGGQYVPAANRGELMAALDQIYGRETRSFLLHFNYISDPSGALTNAAEIEFKPAAGASLKNKIQAPIPIPMVSSPPAKDWRLMWLLSSVASVLLLIGVIVIWRRSGKTEEKPVVTSTPPPSNRVSIPVTATPREHVATRVISYQFAEPKVGQPTALLLGLEGPVDGQQFPMEREVFRIGAGAANDLVIEDDYVSTQHAYLRYEKGSLFIFDQSSRNGTFVNESRVSNTGLVLRPGDRFRIGTSVVEVAIPR